MPRGAGTIRPGDGRAPARRLGRAAGLCALWALVLCAGCRGFLRSGASVPSGWETAPAPAEKAPPLPPSWAMGLWVWEDGFTPGGRDADGVVRRHNRRAVEDLVFGLAEHGIPVDAVLIPHPWSRGLQDLVFFEGGPGYDYGYPDAEGMILRLRRAGVRVLVAVAPAVLREAEGFRDREASTFAPARDAGYLVRDVRCDARGIPIDAAGEPITDAQGGPIWDPERLVHEDRAACRWGRGALIDWSHPDVPRFWQRLCRRVVERGVAGFWLLGGDEGFGETSWKEGEERRRATCLYPGNTWAARSGPEPRATGREEYRRSYYRACARATRELLPEGIWIAGPEPELASELPVVMAGGFAHVWGAEAGAGSNAAGPPPERGSNTAPSAAAPGLRQAVAGVLDAARKGFLVIGCPAGGDLRGGEELPFDPDPRLFIRWIQWSALLPLMLCGGQGEHRPWKIPAFEASEKRYAPAAIFRLFAALHHELRPYLEGAAIRARAAGRSVIRALGETPGEPGPYLLGESLLVHPILSEGTSFEFEFPAGRWIDYFTGTIREGPARMTIEVPYDRYPIFVREGAILPLEVRTSLTGHGCAASATAMTVCIGPAGERAFPLVVRREGEALIGWIRIRPSAGGWEIALPPLDKDVILRVRCAARPAAVRNDGNIVAYWPDPEGFPALREGWTYDAGRRLLLARLAAPKGATVAIALPAGARAGSPDRP